MIALVGSKEEIFFDSQAWLDSDCDDDFLSVNGGRFSFNWQKKIKEKISDEGEKN